MPGEARLVAAHAPRAPAGEQDSGDVFHLPPIVAARVPTARRAPRAARRPGRWLLRAGPRCRTRSPRGARPARQRRQEGVGRIEEVDGLGAVVHRHDEARPQSAHDCGGALAADGRAVADRQEEDVDLADRRLLLRAERALPEIAEMAHAQPVEREAEDRVRPALRARHVIVLGGDRDHLAERRLRACRPSSAGRAASPSIASMPL